MSWGKNNLFPIKEVTNIQSLADIMGCKVDNMHTIYLGMPLGNKNKDAKIWDDIVER